MKITKILLFLSVFLLGTALGIYSTHATAWTTGSTGDSVQFADSITLPSFDNGIVVRENPKDRVPEKAIAVYRDRVVLDLQNTQWATFTDTHSMEPVIFKGANAIEIVPQAESDIKVGDIVSYKSVYAEGNIIHRVVYKGMDEEGTYFIMKGDNLPESDPGRVRFNQIQRVVIAVIY